MVLDERRERVEALRYDYAAQPKQRVRACNLCGHDRFVTIAHHDRYGFPATTSACLACGLAFLDPRLSEDGYGAFYAGVYRPLVSAFHGRLIDAATVEREQVGYAQALAELLAPFLEGRSAGHILDVGGSTGVVAAALAERYGMTGVVVDPAPAEVERARAKGLEAHVGTIESFEAAGSGYDVVLLCQTIDHLLDVAGSLSKLRTLIADDGLLFVDVVDFRAAYLRNRSVEQATKIDHPYSLTEATAEAFLARAGFDVIRKDYAADHLHVGYVCAPAAEKADAVPERDAVARFFAEIRYVQNAWKRG